MLASVSINEIRKTYTVAPGADVFSLYKIKSAINEATKIAFFSIIPNISLILSQIIRYDKCHNNI